MQEFTIVDKMDNEFIYLIMEIDKWSGKLTKHNKLKLDSWIKCLCVPTSNFQWKKNRNLHAILLLDMVINNKFEEPFNKFANPYTPIMSLNRTDVKAKLSNKFYEEISLTDYNDKVIEFVQMPTKEYNTKIINEHSDTLLSRLKLNKTLLKVKGRTNYKSTTSRNSSPRTHQTNSHRSYLQRPVSFYSTALSMNDNLINNYLYIKDIDKLKKLINALNQQITYKDEIILRQEEERSHMEKKLIELENKLKLIVTNIR